MDFRAVFLKTLNAGYGPFSQIQCLPKSTAIIDNILHRAGHMYIIALDV